MVRLRQEQTVVADKKFVVYVVILVVFGLIMLTSASSSLGYTKFQDSYFFVKKQLLFGLAPGVLLFLIFSKISYSWLKKMSWLLYGLTIVLLSLVFISGIGISINGARSWVSFLGISFQPAEFAKLSIIIVLSYLLADRKIDWSNWQTSLVPILAVLAPITLLILLQPDVGTLSILVVIIFVLLYVARVPGRYLLSLGMVGIICFMGLVFAAPYRMNRLTTFLHPELDPQGVGYQINQAYLAVGSGGFWGLGFGHSRQKFQYLPEVNADSIYAVIAEEMGFIISTLVVLLILLIGCRGLKIAQGSTDEYGQFLVTGIMVWFMWQSFLNIGAMVGALPLTGVPLPLISHGGSAYMSVLAALGIVVNVSKHAYIEED